MQIFLTRGSKSFGTVYLCRTAGDLLGFDSDDRLPVGRETLRLMLPVHFEWLETLGRRDDPVSSVGASGHPQPPSGGRASPCPWCRTYRAGFPSSSGCPRGSHRPAWSLVFQHHEADILDRNALLHVGGFSGVNDHLIVPQTQTERCRKEECAFEHGGQRLNLISPVTVRSKSSCSTQALNWVCKIEITGR